eukprot:scaffold26785_cov103-Cylindrotheca_fusiformis.AAC.1
MDLIVHLLGPDLEVVVTELTTLGRRHHHHIEGMQQYLKKDDFQSLIDAFCDSLRAMLIDEAKKEELEVDETSILHHSQMESIQSAWQDIFTMIRVIMKQGVRVEIKSQKKRMEKTLDRRRGLKKQPSRSNWITSDTSSAATTLDRRRGLTKRQSLSNWTSDTSSVASSSNGSSHTSDNQLCTPPSSGPTKRRGLVRMASARVCQAKSLLRSPPLRSSSEHRPKANSRLSEQHQLRLGRP